MAPLPIVEEAGSGPPLKRDRGQAERGDLARPDQCWSSLAPTCVCSALPPGRGILLNRRAREALGALLSPVVNSARSISVPRTRPTSYRMPANHIQQAFVPFWRIRLTHAQTPSSTHPAGTPIASQR